MGAKSRKWVPGGERIPPKVVLGLAVMWTLIALFAVVVALGGDQSHGVPWVQVAFSVLLALAAVYYWALYAHVRRA